MKNKTDKILVKNLHEVNALIASEMGIALYFSAPNCGICEALRPKVAQLIFQEFPAITFIEIASHISPEIAGHYSVFTAPTLLVFFEGKEFSRNVRNLSILELMEKLKRPYNMLTSE